MRVMEISIMFYIEREAWLVLVLVLFPLASCWHGIPNRSFLCGPKRMTGNHPICTFLYLRKPRPDLAASALTFPLITTWGY